MFCDPLAMTTSTHVMTMFVTAVDASGGIDESYTNAARIINLITQGMEVLQKFAIPGHTMARDADLRS